jgi:hypothetical protein
VRNFAQASYFAVRAYTLLLIDQEFRDRPWDATRVLEELLRANCQRINHVNAKGANQCVHCSPPRAVPRGMISLKSNFLSSAKVSSIKSSLGYTRCRPPTNA